MVLAAVAVVVVVAVALPVIIQAVVAAAALVFLARVVAVAQAVLLVHMELAVVAVLAAQLVELVQVRQVLVDCTVVAVAVFKTEQKVLLEQALFALFGQVQHDHSLQQTQVICDGIIYSVKKRSTV
jgi:hypothetical protein